MKKCLILLVILAILAPSVFAQEVDLFQDIEAIEIPDSDYYYTDGDGVAGAVVGGVFGFASGGVYEACRTAVRMIIGIEDRSNPQIGKDILGAMIAGGITGAIGGALPLFP